MSLKSKAKTPMEIAYGYFKIPLTENYPMKWVSLEEAQKLESELKQIKDIANENYHLHRVDELQIAEANKILDSIITNPEFQCFNDNGLIPCKAGCGRHYEQLCKGIQDLRVILEIPRKENDGEK